MVVPITKHKFDAVTEWLLKEGVPITLRNWLEVSYWERVRLCDLGPEQIAEIAEYLKPKKYRRDVDEPRTRGRVLRFKPGSSRV
jgi:hypothetical protein